MNLANLLHRAGKSRRSDPALAVGDSVIADYGHLARRAASLGRSFRSKFALNDGDRVALVMKNCPAYIEALYACWYAGLIAVPVNAKLHPSELRYILEHSGASLCLATRDLAAALEPTLAGLADLKDLIEAQGPAYMHLFDSDPMEPALSEPETPAWLFYTSGTTGRPKGAVLSHRNLLAMSFCYLADVDRIEPGDSILHAAPLSHGSGLYGLPHVLAGACQVIPESGQFDPDETFRLMSAHKGSMLFAAPTMVKRLVEHTGDDAGVQANLKTIVYGGGPMYLEDLKAAIARFGPRFAQIYGQGESPMTITALSKAEHAAKDHRRYEVRLASAGRPQSVVQVRVADDEDHPLPAGEMGEILVRGDSVMLGYWRDEAASAETLRNGWLHTGDLGVFDEDGYLTLKDRSKDLIISGGSNIYPREVEEVLLTHDSVAECAVIGQPHREWGEMTVAFVVPEGNRPPDETALDSHCRDHMARFKRPRAYRFVEALPKNNYGKVLKTELRLLAAVDAESD